MISTCLGPFGGSSFFDSRRSMVEIKKDNSDFPDNRIDYHVFFLFYLVAFLAKAFYQGLNIDDHYWTDELIDSITPTIMTSGWTIGLVYGYII
jgi:hypothetical protein